MRLLMVSPFLGIATGMLVVAAVNSWDEADASYQESVECVSEQIALGVERADIRMLIEGGCKVIR